MLMAYSVRRAGHTWRRGDDDLCYWTS